MPTYFTKYKLMHSALLLIFACALNADANPAFAEVHRIGNYSFATLNGNSELSDNVGNSYQSYLRNRGGNVTLTLMSKDGSMARYNEAGVIFESYGPSAAIYVEQEVISVCIEKSRYTLNLEQQSRILGVDYTTTPTVRYPDGNPGNGIKPDVPPGQYPAGYFDPPRRPAANAMAGQVPPPATPGAFPQPGQIPPLPGQGNPQPLGQIPPQQPGQQPQLKVWRGASQGNPNDRVELREQGNGSWTFVRGTAQSIFTDVRELEDGIHFSTGNGTGGEKLQISYDGKSALASAQSVRSSAQGNYTTSSPTGSFVGNWVTNEPGFPMAQNQLNRQPTNTVTPGAFPPGAANQQIVWRGQKTFQGQTTGPEIELKSLSDTSWSWSENGQMVGTYPVTRKPDGSFFIHFSQGSVTGYELSADGRTARHLSRTRMAPDGTQQAYGAGDGLSGQWISAPGGPAGVAPPAANPMPIPPTQNGQVPPVPEQERRWVAAPNSPSGFSGSFVMRVDPNGEPTWGQLDGQGNETGNYFMQEVMPDNGLLLRSTAPGGTSYLLRDNAVSKVRFNQQGEMAEVLVANGSWQ